MVQWHDEFSLGALHHVDVGSVNILVIYAVFTLGGGGGACGFWPRRSLRGRVGPYLTFCCVQSLLTGASHQTSLFFLFLGMGWDWVHLVCQPLFCQLHRPQMIDDWWWWWLWSSWWNENWQGKLKYSEKTCPSVILSTTNSTWLGVGLNWGCRGANLAIYYLSYCMAWHHPSQWVSWT
jgi:hypothetical protein